MARNIFLLPSFSSQDESGLRDIVEAVALEASTKAGMSVSFNSVDPLP